MLTLSSLTLSINFIIFKSKTITEQNVFELLIESIQSSSATFQEKIKMMDALKAYIDYKYKQTLNLIK